ITEAESTIVTVSLPVLRTERSLIRALRIYRTAEFRIPIVVEAEIPANIAHKESPGIILPEGREQEAGRTFIHLWKKCKGKRNKRKRNIFDHQISGSGNNILFTHHSPADMNTEMGMRLGKITGTIHGVFDGCLIVLVFLQLASLYKAPFHFRVGSIYFSLPGFNGVMELIGVRG